MRTKKQDNEDLQRGSIVSQSQIYSISPTLVVKQTVVLQIQTVLWMKNI